MTSERSTKTYQVPEGCSSCLGAAEKSYTIVGSYQFDDNGMRHTRTYTLKVPICASCKKASILRSAMGFPALIVIAIAGWFIGSLFGGEWHIWGAIGGTIVGIIVAGINWAISAPGEIEAGGLPKFKNPEFQKRFAQINNIDPNRYGLINPLDDTALKYLWERQEENIKAAAESVDPRLLEEIERRAEYSEQYAKAQRDAKSVTDIREIDADKPQAALVFGDGTSFLKFDKGMESRYRAHLRLIENLKAVGVYPELSVCGMIERSNASCARLIIVTGSREEIATLPNVFYTPAAESFVNEEFKGDWSAVTPASTVSNVEQPGMAVDLGPYDELCQEVRRGGFDLDKTLW